MHALQREVALETLTTGGPPSSASSQSKIPVWKSQPEVHTLLHEHTMGDVATAKQTTAREKEMELLRQTVKVLAIAHGALSGSTASQPVMSSCVVGLTTTVAGSLVNFTLAS